VTTDASRNRDHWEQLGARYADNWANPGQRALGDKELSFVIGHLRPGPGQTILDVGIGAGRVLGDFLRQDRVAAVYGVDAAVAMVAACKARFDGHPKLKKLLVRDIAIDDLPVPANLDFVSAVRILKYNRNWWEIVEAKLAPHLAPGGVLVFSMPNTNSLKWLSRPYAVDYFKTTRKELQQRLPAANLELLEFSGFSKVPDVLYRKARGGLATRSLLAVERGLDRAIGPASLAKELFVAARRRA
jgi:SAM-dependent methyltransferase